MKEARIDVTQGACQDPVVKVKSVLEQLREQKISVSKIEILGDSELALDGVENFLINNGYIFETSGNGERFAIIVKGKEEIKIEALEEKPIEFEDKILLFKDDRIGEGELGKKLADGFLTQLSLSYKLPKEIIFLNRGVLLCADSRRNTNILKDLQNLEQKGVRILLCRTCLEALRVKESVAVGKISNAQEIMDRLLSSPVISL